MNSSEAKQGLQCQNEGHVDKVEKGCRSRIVPSTLPKLVAGWIQLLGSSHSYSASAFLPSDHGSTCTLYQSLFLLLDQSVRVTDPLL
jgi:hypothetical protein